MYRLFEFIMEAADKIRMDLRFSFHKVMRRRGFITPAIVVFFLLPALLFAEMSSADSIQAKRPADLLREIYKEVASLERFPNDSFIKGEFHINLDGNEENKEEHILVLNHFASGREKMLVQVTYYESRRKNSPVKYARSIREIECCIFDERVEIERCDYSEMEIKSLLPGILEGIRDTKKILDLIDKRNDSDRERNAG
jgi:hypothetical protein